MHSGLRISVFDHGSELAGLSSGIKNGFDCVIPIYQGCHLRRGRGLAGMHCSWIADSWGNQRLDVVV